MSPWPGPSDGGADASFRDQLERVAQGSAGQIFPPRSLPESAMQTGPVGSFLRTVGGLVRWSTAAGADVSNVPAGSIASTTVQGAINELATEKVQAPVVVGDGQCVVWDQASGTWISRYLAKQKDLDRLRDEFDAHNHDDRYAQPRVPWTQLPLLTGYGNFASGTYSPVLFMKDALGTVFVRGLVEILAGAPTVNVCQFPVGCRPLQAILYPLLTSGGVARFDLDGVSGVMTQPSLAVGTWMSFNFSFKAEQ